jgi:predicted nucleotidyltransferase
MFGLSNEVYLKIMNIVKKYKYDFYIFGSRARGDYKKNSDIDIAIYGEVTDKEEFYIRNDFDIINIQYTVDLIFVNKIEKQQLLDSIKKEGIKLNGKI